MTVRFSGRLDVDERGEGIFCYSLDGELTAVHQIASGAMGARLEEHLQRLNTELCNRAKKKPGSKQ